MSPVIKKLVVAGGAHMGFSYFGALKTLSERKFFTMANIDTIYATSVGTILAVFLSLQCDWKSLEEYLVNRSWKRIFPTNIRNALMAVPKGGLFDISTVEKILEPVLLDRDLSLDTTLQEFYEYNKKDMHFITTLYEPLAMVDLSHKTHPEWRLVDAVYASACLPVLFVPYCRNTNETYVDGAMYDNYPIDQCLNNSKIDEVLGVSFNHSESEPMMHNKSPLRLFFFLLDFISKVLRLLKNEPSIESKRAPYQVEIEGDSRFHEALDVISSTAKRREMIKRGEISAIHFLESIQFNESI